MEHSTIQGDPEGLGLGLVDLIWGVPPAGGPLLQLLTAQAGWWNIPNLSQPNPGPRPSGSPCSNNRRSIIRCDINCENVSDGVKKPRSEKSGPEENKLVAFSSA